MPNRWRTLCAIVCRNSRSADQRGGNDRCASVARRATPLRTMFKKVLIANRGEIAVRIIRTLHEMGIRAVAIFSDADKAALHVRMADEAYNVGPASPRESYLNIDRVVATAKKAGVDAIHPGY